MYNFALFFKKMETINKNNLWKQFMDSEWKYVTNMLIKTQNLNWKYYEQAWFRDPSGTLLIFINYYVDRKLNIAKLANL